MIGNRERWRAGSLILLLALVLSGCTAAGLVSTPAVTSPLLATPLPGAATGTLTPAAEPAATPIPIYSYRVVHSYPHDRGAFTEGLVFSNGDLYESTGLLGRSSVRRVDLLTGSVLQSLALGNQYFGEGLTVFQNRLIQLTWQSHTGFVYALQTFGLLGQFSYPNEGWGLTQDGQRLIMSDGSSTLHFLDPQTLTETGHLDVRADGASVSLLNELEFVNGQIYANIWKTDRIARIDPQTGQVVGWIDLTGLISPLERPDPEAVLNGIAYDAQNQRLFVTGKLWPRLFEITLVAPGAP
jgi:glutaminyl-peptide cyclotransferase